MKKALALFYVFLCSVSHADKGASKVVAVESDAKSKIWSVNLRGGLVLENPDRTVISKWEHKPFESYKYAIGGSAYFPPSWNQIKFLSGAEFQYITARQELSGAYNATIDTTITQFVLFGGAEYRPFWAQGFSGNLVLGIPLAATKTAKLDAQGFTQDLGREGAYADTLIGFPIYAALNLFYDLGDFRPCLSWDSDNSVTLGGAYVF